MHNQGFKKTSGEVFSFRNRSFFLTQGELDSYLVDQ